VSFWNDGLSNDGYFVMSFLTNFTTSPDSA
jgi:hypothetical protein